MSWADVTTVLLLIGVAACASDPPARRADAGVTSDSGAPVVDAGPDVPPPFDAGADAAMPLDAGVDAPSPDDAGPDAPPPEADAGSDAGLPPGTCGDGVRNRADGEACDDGNTLGGDACDETCQPAVFAIGEPSSLPTNPSATVARDGLGSLLWVYDFYNPKVGSDHLVYGRRFTDRGVAEPIAGEPLSLGITGYAADFGVVGLGSGWFVALTDGWRTVDHDGTVAPIVPRWDPLESTCRHASLSIL